MKDRNPGLLFREGFDAPEARYRGYGTDGIGEVRSGIRSGIRSGLDSSAGLFGGGGIDLENSTGPRSPVGFEDRIDGC